MKTGHVEKTNDRDYEVEERQVECVSIPGKTDSSQTIPYDGSRFDEVSTLR